MRATRVLVPAALAALPLLGCSSQPAVPNLGPGTFDVQVTSVNGSTTLPVATSPLPPNLGVEPESWAFTIEARTPTGDVAQSFNGYVSVNVVPGTVLGVIPTGAPACGSSGDCASGFCTDGKCGSPTNILLANGTASGVIQSTGVYGPAHLWVQDLGYLPAAPSAIPKCSNGIDDNHNGLIDFPADPGCYYADDDSEEGGTYAAGVSSPIYYALPKISQVRGGAVTPYPNEAIEISATDPSWLVVTSIASNGFFVTDLDPTQVPQQVGGQWTSGYNSLFAYNFSAPPSMQVCDRVTQLSGTANQFYGFTQLSFPSFENIFGVPGQDGGAFDPKVGIPGCRVPEPIVLDPAFFTGQKNTTSQNLFRFEAGLVRVQGFTIAKYFGSKLAKFNNFGPGQSNCDFNGNGQIDYTSISPNCPVGECEGDCSNLCDTNPDCTEYTAYSARQQYKASYQGSAAATILLNTSVVPSFDPVGNAGATIDVVTGSLTEFSGGSLNWTVQARCDDDVVCPAALGCTTQVVLPAYRACVQARTISDNDEGTN